MKPDSVRVNGATDTFSIGCGFNVVCAVVSFQEFTDQIPAFDTAQAYLIIKRKQGLQLAVGNLTLAQISRGSAGNIAAA